MFVRSRNEQALENEKRTLLAACWPGHAAVILSLDARSILCFSGTNGRWAREQMNAHEPIDQFSERNRHRWISRAHQAADGRIVATLTHPSRADWINPFANPTPFVAHILAKT